MNEIEEAFARGKSVGWDAGYEEGLYEAERGYEDGIEEGYQICQADIKAKRLTTLIPLLEELFRQTQMFKDRPPTFEEIADAVSEELAYG